MKVLLYGNAPSASTGYGVQLSYLADMLASVGHEVAVACTWGHQSGVSKWTSPGGHEIRLYPSGFDRASNDIVCEHALHWFDNDPKGGWIIAHNDMWVVKNPALAEFNVAAWAPVDHLPCPPDVVEFFHMSGAVPIAMSKFGAEQFRLAGLTPLYVPLAVDTDVFKPTHEISTQEGDVVSARELFSVPEDAFVVGMVGMNKGWAKDRKGFNEAFRAFGAFWQENQDAVLLVHSEQLGGAEGVNLVELAQHAAIPEHALVWTDQYAYRLGLPPEMMAALYSAMDVLLAPSHGEGFCVPVIEAQACDTPVIVSDFSAQPELVRSGIKVPGQLEWDPAQHASYLTPFTASIVEALGLIREAIEEGSLESTHVEIREEYGVEVAYERYWEPVLNLLDPPPPEPKDPLTEESELDIIVPLMREENAERFWGSLGDGFDGAVHVGVEGRSYAENVNALLEHSEAPWVLIVGDDVEFLPGWFEAAAEVSTQADVIGTNDSEPGRVRNRDVAAGRHADHFFVRREYIEEQGASLDGPGSLMHEGYRHWFTDKELIELAKARGVFVMAPECRIVHHHPGYDGDEGARQADPVYMAAVDGAEADRKTWLRRSQLVELQR